MNWKYIKDQIPEDGSDIIQIDLPQEEHCYIGFRKFNKEAFERYARYCREEDMPMPDFFWMYKKEFPFPKSIDQNVSTAKESCESCGAKLDSNEIYSYWYFCDKCKKTTECQ